MIIIEYNLPITVFFLFSIGALAHLISLVVGHCQVGYSTILSVIACGKAIVVFGGSVQRSLLVPASSIHGDLADRSSVDPGVLPLSQIRHASSGSPSYSFRKAFDSSWVCDSESYSVSSPAFRFLLECFRSGPEYRVGDSDDIGAPD